ncbi:MAG TPA: hypothetical protein VNU70_09290 [Puia sp.]|nr:hypothetical protein [Puia sp.]
MLLDGKIQTFTDTFEYIKKSVVARDIGKKVERFTELMNDVDDFRVGELRMMAKLFNLTLDEMFNLIAREVEKKKPDQFPTRL